MYAFYIWGHSQINGKKMEELHKINKLICKMLTPVRNTTPRKSLEVIYNLTPLDLFGTYEAIEIINELNMMIAGTNLHHMMSRTQKVITKLVHWGQTVGLTFNPEKTVVIIFTKSNLKQYQYPNRLQINEQRICFSHITKYLGVTLDSKLTWTTHWNNVIQRAREYVFMLIPFITRRWGPKPLYIKWVYTAIVRPRIMYAFYIWGHSQINGKKMEELHKINKLICKMLTPVRHTTPRKSLEVIYNLSLIHI